MVFRIEHKNRKEKANIAFHQDGDKIMSENYLKNNNNWVLKTSDWVLLRWREEYRGWSDLQSMRLLETGILCILLSSFSFPLLPSPANCSNFSTLRYNAYDLAFLQRTSVPLFSQKRGTSKRKTHKWPSLKGYLHYVFFMNYLEFIPVLLKWPFFTINRKEWDLQIGE